MHSSHDQQPADQRSMLLLPLLLLLLLLMTMMMIVIAMAMAMAINTCSRPEAGATRMRSAQFLAHLSWQS